MIKRQRTNDLDCEPLTFRKIDSTHKRCSSLDFLPLRKVIYKMLICCGGKRYIKHREAQMCEIFCCRVIIFWKYSLRISFRNVCVECRYYTIIILQLVDQISEINHDSTRSKTNSVQNILIDLDRNVIDN